MTPRAKDFIKHVMILEGAKSDHPEDSGEETVWGISRKHHPQMFERGNPSYEDAFAFYEEHYWLRLHCDKLHNDALAYRLLDLAVNCGMMTAARCAQMAYNKLAYETWPRLITDGMVGPKTIALLNNASAQFGPALVEALRYQQANLYWLGNPTFQRGWFSRLSKGLDVNVVSQEKV